MQGGVDASGGESVEMHAKSDKATAANSKRAAKIIAKPILPAPRRQHRIQNKKIPCLNNCST
jgi:hypothetical protein